MLWRVFNFDMQFILFHQSKKLHPTLDSSGRIKEWLQLIWIYVCFKINNPAHVRTPEIQGEDKMGKILIIQYLLYLDLSKMLHNEFLMDSHWKPLKSKHPSVEAKILNIYTWKIKMWPSQKYYFYFKQ